jgi:hypothetical protein
MKRTSVMGMTKQQFQTLWLIRWYSFKKHIRIGDWVEALIHTISLGYGERISLAIARLFGKNSCGCCERKQWLNRLTDSTYDGKCNQINLNWYPTYD